MAVNSPPTPPPQMTTSLIGGFWQVDRRPAESAHHEGVSRRTSLARAGVVLAALIGTVGGLAVTPRVQADVGPFVMSASARPYFGGQTTVRLVPLGSIRLDTHDAP